MTGTRPQIREEDIRPAELMAAKQRCVVADREFLLTRRDQWVQVVCPACGAEEHSAFGDKEGFAYVECRDCATVYTNPRPSKDLLREFYEGSANYAFWNEHVFPATESSRRERIFRPRAERLAAILEGLGWSPRAILEVGAAFGTFCEELRAVGLAERIIALEPTPDLASTCRERGFEVLECFIEDVEDEGIVDVVAAFEVIEHLFAPREFMKQCHRVLQSDGLMVLSCPNVRGFDTATLGVQSSTFDHEHVNYFHPESLSTLVEASGFEVLEITTPGQLDAELVRNQVLDGAFELPSSRFLDEVLIRRWDELGSPFQAFLAENRLSSHMWLIAKRS